MNVITPQVIGEIEQVVDHIAADASIRGCVIASGKDNFSGGADLSMLQTAAAEYLKAKQEKGEARAFAYVTANAGMEVVLIDQDRQAADKGKDICGKLISGQVLKGRATAAFKEALLARIKPTADYRDLAGSDLVIEAVFEDRAVKADATKKARAALQPGTIFASNTSTLPITFLAQA